MAGTKVRELRFFSCQVIGFLKHGATGNFRLISDDGFWLNPAPLQLVAITTANPAQWIEILPAETEIRKLYPKIGTPYSYIGRRVGPIWGPVGVYKKLHKHSLQKLENTPNPLSPHRITIMSSTLDTITPMPEGGKNQTSVNISKEDLKVKIEHYESIPHIASTYDGLIVSTQSSRRL